MNIMICPQCRRLSDRPMFLPRAQQIIFNYIWDHPWCSILEIEHHTITHTSSNLVAVQVSKIRNNLTGTPYKLTTRPGPITGRHRPQRQYRIEEVKCPSPIPSSPTPTA